MLRLQVKEESDLRRWEEDLKLFSATPFFAPSWLECFRTKTRRPTYLRFVSEGKTIGLAAGLQNEPFNRALRKFFRILFFYSGPAVVAQDRGLTQLCLENLIGYARENKFTHVKLESWDFASSIDVDALPIKPIVRKEYVLDMRPSLSELVKSVKKMRKREIRAAERNGLTFHESYSPSILNNLLILLEETKSIRLSKNYQNYNYLYISYLNRETLYKLFENRIVRASYVKNEVDGILSVSLDAVHHKRAYGLFIGTNQAGYKLKSNTFMNFKLIEKFKEEGIESYNFGGVPSDESARGLRFFKTSFGAIEKVCTGGRTHHLQSPFINHLAEIYTKFPETKLKKIIRKSLTGRNYS
jgi:lipid II:glycine glycyltransferase (peptidoglycan interpeptide bridge formation enzyme)